MQGTAEGEPACIARDTEAPAAADSGPWAFFFLAVRRELETRVLRLDEMCCLEEQAPESCQQRKQPRATA